MLHLAVKLELITRMLNHDWIRRSIMTPDTGGGTKRSTTTKAILIEKVGDEYRQTYRGEAPTTVEAPFEDVTRGVLNAIAEIEELSGRKILDGDKILTPNRAAQGDPKTGVDIYISTSSAGGGLGPSDGRGVRRRSVHRRQGGAGRAGPHPPPHPSGI